MTVKELATGNYERHLERFNNATVRLRDSMLLDAAECDELLTIINERLPGRGNEIAHWLRQALCEAVDTIRAEDVLAKLPAESKALAPCLHPIGASVPIGTPNAQNLWKCSICGTEYLR